MSNSTTDSNPSPKQKSQDLLGLSLLLLGGFAAVSIFLAMGGRESSNILNAPVNGLSFVFGRPAGLCLSVGISVLGALMFLRDGMLDPGRHLLGVLGLGVGLSLLIGAYDPGLGGGVGGAPEMIFNQLGGRILCIVLGLLVLGASSWVAWFNGFSLGAPRVLTGSARMPPKRAESDGVSAEEALALQPEKEVTLQPRSFSYQREDVRLRGGVPEGAMPLGGVSSAQASVELDEPLAQELDELQDQELEAELASLDDGDDDDYDGADYGDDDLDDDDDDDDEDDEDEGDDEDDDDDQDDDDDDSDEEESRLEQVERHAGKHSARAMDLVEEDLAEGEELEQVEAGEFLNYDGDFADEALAAELLAEEQAEQAALDAEAAAAAQAHAETRAAASAADEAAAAEGLAKAEAVARAEAEAEAKATARAAAQALAEAEAKAAAELAAAQALAEVEAKAAAELAAAEALADAEAAARAEAASELLAAQALAAAEAKANAAAKREAELLAKAARTAKQLALATAKLAEEAKSPVRGIEAASAQQAGLFEELPSEEQPQDFVITPASSSKTKKKRARATGEQLPLDEPQAREDALSQPAEKLEAKPATSKSRRKARADAKAQDKAEPADKGTSEVSIDLVLRAGELVLEENRVAVSMLQRRFEIGFDEACVVLDKLQDHGLIGPYVGGRNRDIILGPEEWRARASELSQA